MDHFLHFDAEDFQAELLRQDGTLWTAMEKSNLYNHLDRLPRDLTSFPDAAIAEMWFQWWLENDAELSPKLPEKAFPGQLHSMLNKKYHNVWEMFGIGEYSFLSDVQRKVPSGLLHQAVWKRRPDPELLRSAGEHAAQVALMMTDDFPFEVALTWVRRGGEFHPENPSRQILRYRGLIALGIEREQAVDLLLEHRSRPLWQIEVLADGMPTEYVDALGD